MTALLPVADVQRRARLVARHHLDGSAASVAAVVRDVVALHSSDPSTPYLASRARMKGFRTDHLADAIVTERSLWRLHAMRRTLFIVPSEEWPVFHGAASRDVARQERRRVEGWVGAELGAEDASRLIRALEDRVLEVLAEGREVRTQDLLRGVPELGREVTLGSGKWAARSPIGPRILYLLAMEGRIVRTRPSGSWRSSQYHWAAASPWFGTIPQEMDPAAARIELARRYLRSYGPATIEDLRWWTGWTVKQVNGALAGLETERVRLEGGDEGLLLRDDLDLPAEPTPGAALLPALDPTPMGWKRRDWYLGGHASSLFDTNGNVGPSVWWAGRIVGGWAQAANGEVVFQLLEDVGEEARTAITAEAAAATEWLQGTVVIPRFRTPLERALMAAHR